MYGDDLAVFSGVLNFLWSILVVAFGVVVVVLLAKIYAKLTKLLVKLEAPTIDAKTSESAITQPQHAERVREQEPIRADVDLGDLNEDEAALLRMYGKNAVLRSRGLL